MDNQLELDQEWNKLVNFIIKGFELPAHLLNGEGNYSSLLCEVYKFRQELKGE